MKLATKNLAMILALTTLIAAPAYAAKKGGDSGGGGDAEEARVNEIRLDILSWIQKGGARELALPSDISLGEYEDQMTSILEKQKVAIAFTNDLVKVKGVEKTCRGAFVIEKGLFSERKTNPQILCNISRFKATEESKQYPLIHHEYAGLVNIEKNDGAASDYEISNQITDFLETKTIKRLAVKKKPEPKPVRDTSLNSVVVKSAYTFNKEETLPECQSLHSLLEQELIFNVHEKTKEYLKLFLEEYYNKNGLTQIENITVTKKSETRKEEKFTEIKYEIVVFAKEDSATFTLIHTIEDAIYKNKYIENVTHFVDKVGRIKGKELKCSLTKAYELTFSPYGYSYDKRASHNAILLNSETNHTIDINDKSFKLSDFIRMAYEQYAEKKIEIK